ncbi:MAG: ATP-binding cassette domain-containing protein [Kiritimatiellae bacterium]|nr:ATP-binding cassette domain-containing protein [Kiritimatiellia bacterium]
MRKISLDIAAGEFAVVLGDNGAGKTTLLRAILGLTPKTSGIIILFGRQISWRNRRALQRRIGYVPQWLPFDETMPVSAREVIAIGRCARIGVGRRLGAGDRGIVEEAAEMAGVGRLLDRPVGQLSGGERQKVQIARAICQEPELLLLDEFSAHLSESAGRDCLQLLGKLHRQNRFTILMVTHDIAGIPAECRRAIVLAGGTKQFDGSLGDWRGNHD